MGGGMILSVLYLTTARISDLSSICSHSKEFNFLQEGGLWKKLPRKYFTSVKTDSCEWRARFIWEQGVGKYVKHVLKSSNSTSQLLIYLRVLGQWCFFCSSLAQGFRPWKAWLCSLGCKENILKLGFLSLVSQETIWVLMLICVPDCFNWKWGLEEGKQRERLLWVIAH